MRVTEKPFFCSILLCLLLQQSPVFAALEELYTTTATGLDVDVGVNGTATYQMLEVGTGDYVADWKATVVATNTVVNFRILSGQDDPRIANRNLGTTTIRWESFDPGTTTPHPANYCINIADLDGSRTETVTVTKADIFSYTLSVPTNITVVDNGSTIAFTGTTDNSEEADAVRLCMKQLSTWNFTYSQSSSGDSAYSHDVDADFPFIGGVVTNFGYTITESAGDPVLTEGGSTVTFDVVLDYAPASDVVIDFSSADTSEATVSPSRLTFTNGDWNVVQTVTVTGVDDNLVDGDQNTNITAVINDAMSDDTFDPLGDVTMTVTTIDDDTAGFTLGDTGSKSVNESGSTDTFTVVLDAQPDSDVVIDISSGDVGEATVSPANLTFTSGDWDTAQTVTVTGVDDALIDGVQNTTITIAINDAGSDDNFDALSDQTVTVSTTDNDSAGFTVVESSGTTAVSELGTTDTFTVVLNAQPDSDVVIDISSGDTGEATVSPASLTFTNGNWSAAQTVTVTGVDDNLIDGVQNTTITIAINDAGSDDNFDALSDQTVTVSTTDNDSAGFTVVESSGTTAVSEAGTADTFTVVLTAQPDSDVVIDISSGDTGEATVSPASLTFTNGNWSTAQTVTVTGVDDDLIDGVQNTTITIAVNDAGSDDNFDALTDQTVTATTTNNDTAGFTVVESGGATSVDETGTTDTFTVVLDAQPDSDVVIDIGSGDTGEATVSPASLTFTNGNWNSTQTVTVTGVDDALVDSAQYTTITISINDAGSDNNFDLLANQTVTTTTVDNDTAGFAVAESSGSTAVNESGTADTFTVVLTGQPVNDVVIDISSSDTGEATVSPASLTFTNGNWNLTQTVTVTGVDDALIDGSQNVTLTLSINDAGSDDNFDALADQAVTATNTDDDMAGFTVTESAGSTAVNESGTADTFAVVLNAQPDSDVIIDISSGDTGEVTVSPASLTFTNGNWNMAQTVTVTGVEDTLVDGSQNTTVTVSVNDAGSDDNFDPLADQTVAVSTIDNDAAGFTFTESAGSTAVNESGTTDTFTVVLTGQPANDVVIDVSSSDTGEATVNPASLTFTNGNWDSAQTVTVTGVDDALIDGNQNVTVTLSINDAGSDNNFDALPDQILNMSVVDNDAPGFTIVESGGDTSVNESGTTDTIAVVLNSQPGSDVVINVSSGDTGEATVSPAGLTFTSGNWNTAQTVTVTGVDDALVDGLQTTTITLSVNDAGSDDSFDPLPDQTIAVATIDDDAPGFAVTESGGSTSVSESGTTDTFGVVLNTQPAGDVVIDISSGDTGEAAVSPASLTFTNGNWNTAQTVTVTGVDDLISDGTQTVTVTVSVNDAGSDDVFDPLPDQLITVAVADDETGLDADNDGIPNVIEGAVDTDMDGTADFLDTDSDNDGIPDNVEENTIPPLTGVDGDSDGIDNAIDVDLTGGFDINGDGIDDRFEPDDSDGDGWPDYVDVDSDNDGIPDGIEADNVPVLTGVDTDGDGIDDALDVDSVTGADANGNGVVDRYEPRDSDGDGTPDYRDTDSDNDGIHDSAEGDVLFADTDGDGIDDGYDADITGGADVDGDGVDDSAAPDNDSDGRPDYRELDSDNDGIPDVVEAGLTDADGDGFVDNATTTMMPQDTDLDSSPDYRDPDSDSDGSFDIVAAGYAAYDLNNDGRIDTGFFSDPDFDGVASVIDPAPTVFGLFNDGDGDDLPVELDSDDDNDGIPDSVESPGGVDVDSDGDGVVDRMDKDSDNDGIPDSIEAFFSTELDMDLDGSIDNFSDTNGDGLADAVSATMIPEDSDADGIPDYLDTDSDNDGVYDLLEFTLSAYGDYDQDGDGRIDLTTDSDGDGYVDALDPDSGNNTVFSILDSDNDGFANFRDSDSDNDGFDDGLENGDFNGNGTLDFIEGGSGITTSVSGSGGGSFSLFWIWILLLFCTQKSARRR